MSMFTVDLTGHGWQEQAKCIGHLDDGDGDSPYDLSFQKHKHTNKDEHARRLCEGCPVIQECAAFALDTQAVEVVMAGVWLGTSNTGHAMRPSTRRLRHIARGLVTT